MSEPPTTDETEAIIQRLLDRAHRAEDRLQRIYNLFAGGPDTSCRTRWRGGPGGEDDGWSNYTECVEVPIEDLRRALDD